MIYGIALLAICFLLGKAAGELLGMWLGIDANVGGVGFSMILLIFSMQWLHRLRPSDIQWEGGIIFWSNLYIPVIVAMSAVQNVKGALGGGLMALLAGVIPAAVCLALVPRVARLGKTVNKE
ncbi:MAG: malonate transporter subunit MadL [Cyclobacteriaceae bacterium]|nr:malonate transporter subunit MadL [Cyclobacteriaceae bacterium]